MYKPVLHETVLNELTNSIQESMGLFFAKDKWGDLERGLLSIHDQLGYRDIESLAVNIINNLISTAEKEALASALTIGETYFFREMNSLNAFEYTILPELIKAGNRRIRIWSAGCASGEEPYTIAMILKKALPDIDSYDISILATDINMKFIRKALSGIYTRWSFRDVPHWIIDKYFIRRDENEFELADEIKKMATFSYLNLMDDSFPSLLNDTNAMNVIFCRNVLMYFSGETIKKVTHKFLNSLDEGGYFIVSQTELSEYYFNEFHSVRSSGGIVYRKVSDKKQKELFTPESAPASHKKHAAAGSSLKRFIFSERSSPAPPAEPLPEKSGIKTSAKNDIDLIRDLYDKGDYDAAMSRLIPLVSAEKNNSEALTLLARVYANKGKLGDALKYCMDAVAADSMNPSNHFLIASIYKETGVHDQAVSALRKAIYLNSDFIMAYYTLGILLLGQNNRKDAEKNLDTALSLLKNFKSDQFVPESEGIPAGRLIEIIESVKMRL